MNKIDFIKNRVIAPKDFIGKKFNPSLQTLGAFLKVFNVVYKGFLDLIEIRNIEWDKEEFKITLIDKNNQKILNLVLRDNFGNKKCNGILCTNNICTGVHYEVQNENFLKFLVHFKVNGVNFKFKDFLEILTKDLKAKKEYYQIFWKAERLPFSIIQDWGYELHKYRFLLHEGVLRNLDQSIFLNLPEAFISHSERECQGSGPNNEDKGYHFFNFPYEYYNHNFDKYYYLTKNEKKRLTLEKELNSTGVNTDLNENDIVMGKGTDKLSEAIDYIIKEVEEKDIKVVSFNCCCVPRIVGDDIYSVLKKAKERIKVPFIFRGQLEKTPFEQRIDLLELYINKVNVKRIIKTKKSISLFGYNENIYQKFLWDILKKNSIKINASFIPSIDVRLLEMMYQSELFVFSQNNFQKEIFEYPFKSLGIKYIIPKYPYGLEYTEEWIKSILDEFNINLKENKNINQIKIDYKNYVKYVKEQELNVLIILIGKKEVEKFLNPDYMNNIDITYFLDEMGFKIKFFVYDNFTSFSHNMDDSYKISDGNHEEILDIIKTKNISIDVSFFSGKNGYEEIFINNRLDLVYSDIYFDYRLPNRGINQFNLKNFYLGYQGALDTIKGLIKLCEINFYKKYSKYFNK